MAGKKGCNRVHTRKNQDPNLHRKYTPYLRMKAQAQFRGEAWDFSFEEYLSYWTDENWAQKGRSSQSLCLTRIDPEQGWFKENVELLTRAEMVKRVKQYIYG